MSKPAVRNRRSTDRRARPAILGAAVVMEVAIVLLGGANHSHSQNSLIQCSNGEARIRVDSSSMIPLATMGSTLILQCIRHVSVSEASGALPETMESLQPTVKLGDVVAFRTKVFDGGLAFKRIVGVPGDSVQIMRRTLLINAVPVPREDSGIYKWDRGDGLTLSLRMFSETLPNGLTYLTVEGSREYSTQDTDRVTVPEGYVFTIGDHRDESIDSRRATAGSSDVSSLGLIRISDLLAKLVDVTAAIDVHIASSQVSATR